MLLKSIAFLITSALLLFIFLVLIGAYSADYQFRGGPSTTRFRTVNNECADLRPLLEQLIAERTNQPMAQFEE